MTRPYEGPDAAEVAAIIVCASIETGEGVALQRAIAGGQFGEARLRARWVAVDVLLRLYPMLSQTKAARLCGKPDIGGAYAAAHKASWWDPAMVERVISEAA